MEAIKRETKSKDKSLLVINFIKLMAFLLMLLIPISYFIYKNSNDLVKNEFTQANLSNAQRVADLTETIFGQIKNIASNILVSNNVRLYMTTATPTEMVGEFDSLMKNTVSEFPSIYSYIESVYVYSEVGECVYSSIGNRSLDNFSDDGWLDTYKKMQDGFEVIARAKNDSYPFVLTFIKKAKTFGNNGAVIVNVSVRGLTPIIDNGFQDILIVTENKEVIYKKNIYTLFEPIGNYPLITSKASEILTDEKGSFASARSEIKGYGWDVVSIAQIESYKNKAGQVHAYVVPIILLLIIAGIGIAFLSSMSVYKPVKKLVDFLEIPEVESGALVLDNSSEVKYIAQKITSLLQHNSALQKETQAQITLLNKTQFYVLQKQINPHFIFNTLNLISLSIVDEVGFDSKAATLIAHMADMLHYTLELEEDIVGVETEIKIVSSYVEILKRRHEGVFKTVWDIDDGILKLKMPKLTLQPIIENAVHHGIVPRNDSEGKLMISGRIAGHELIFEISDNGVGIEPGILDEINRELEKEPLLDSSHIGIRNVHQRIRLTYGNAYGIKVESTGKGTRVIINLPALVTKQP